MFSPRLPRRWVHCELSFPWRFNDQGLFRLMPLQARLHNELLTMGPGFAAAYREVLSSLAGGRVAELAEAVEPGLMKHLQDGLATISRRSWKLELLNTSLTPLLHFYNERLVKGVHIDRKRNRSPRYELTSMADFVTMEGSRMSPRHILLYKGEGERDNTLIFKVDVVFYTGLKLVLFDSDGLVLKGEDSKMAETHMMRFETEVPKAQGRWSEATTLGEAFSHYVMGWGQGPVREYAWRVCDIDFFMKGNRFVDSERTVIPYM